MGYYQVEVDGRSIEKLAFVGPNNSIYSYRFMPFGPVNGLPIFVGMMFDMNLSGRLWPSTAVFQSIKMPTPRL